jgi:hypothetical protein
MSGWRGRKRWNILTYEIVYHNDIEISCNSFNKWYLPEYGQVLPKHLANSNLILIINLTSTDK